MNKADYSLMYVTDERITEDTLFFDTLQSSLKGGVTIVQLREKLLDTRDFYNRALKTKEICDYYNVPLIINDRIDIALSINAHGVHIGQQDLPPAITRKILGSDKIIGWSVSNEEQALKANSLEIDYIGLSPVFSTATKTENLEKPLGISGLSRIKSISNKPIICIGGIDHSNTEVLIENGAEGIAVVSAISTSEQPQQATEKFKKLLCRIGTNK
ncbi:thiamine-phosphate pyrophosphorylase [Nonlabens sp. MIC269]|uniref:thiamine phosphate synthase n=1 Tax=Nonlabens sp. MIC269 TaxID=1476901 RepID=UPI00071F6E8E|nr:thiamine phosphate synthase [Nonlabens sp. MIC269]ALM21774.1 thiamine-phosphate pyrophosphorylase [Nonlabens sp. MIC269]